MWTLFFLSINGKFALRAKTEDLCFCREFGVKNISENEVGMSKWMIISVGFEDVNDGNTMWKVCSDTIASHLFQDGACLKRLQGDCKGISHARKL
jgi:hypothetical protein